jgi:branched-chain amino acid aminotransferase
MKYNPDYLAALAPPTSEQLTQDPTKRSVYGKIIDIENQDCPPEIYHENLRRLNIVLPNLDKKHSVCPMYQTIHGYFIVELRDIIGGGRDPHKQKVGIKKRIKNCSKSIRLRLTDQRLPDFDDFIAGREKEGVVITTVTEDNPYGYATSQEQTGHMLEDIVPAGLLARKMKHQFITQIAQAPDPEKKGLNYIPVHAKAYAEIDTSNHNTEWGKTEILPSGAVALSSANYSAAKYAFSIFEGMQVQTNEAGEIIFFGHEEHAARFRQSAELMGMPPMEIEQFITSVVESVKMNKAYLVPGTTFYLSICMLGADGGAGAKNPPKYIFEIEGFPMSAYLAGPEASVSMEINTEVSRPSLTGQAKTGSNYGPYFKLKEEAKARGFDDIICIDKNGFIEEVSSAAPFFVELDPNNPRRYRLVTPIFASDVADPKLAKERHMLDSITRKTVIEMAERLGLEVVKRDIHFDEIQNMVGAFATGTAAGITRIGKLQLKEDIDSSKEYNDPQVTRFIRALYDDLMSVRKGDPNHKCLQPLVDKYVSKL